MRDFTALENYTSVYWSKLPFTCILSHLAFLLIYVFLTVLLTFYKYALLNWEKSRKKQIVARKFCTLTNFRTFTKQVTWKGDHGGHQEKC